MTFCEWGGGGGERRTGVMSLKTIPEQMATIELEANQKIFACTNIYQTGINLVWVVWLKWLGSLGLNGDDLTE